MTVWGSDRVSVWTSGPACWRLVRMPGEVRRHPAREARVAGYGGLGSGESR